MTPRWRGFTKMNPSVELVATPPQLPPPSDPGNTRLGTMPYGVYGPALTDLSNSSVQYFSASGEILLTSLRVMLSRVRPRRFDGEGLRRPGLDRRVCRAVESAALRRQTAVRRSSG